MNNSPKESHSLSFHPRVWKWLNELAQSDYDGNLSAAVSALILYDRGVRNAKRLQNQAHGHYLTRGVPQDPDRLEAAMMEIEGLDPGFNAMTWLEIQKRKTEESE